MSTSIVSRERDYQDLDLDFLAHPITKDVVKKTGPDAVGRAIRNLVLTNFYDRKFRSYIGSNAIKLLFDNISPLTATLLQEHIQLVVSNFEPRVAVLDVNVIADPENNQYIARIVFSVNNRPEPFQTSIALERIR